MPATAETPTLPASLLMKYGLLIILTLTTIFQSVGQDIEVIALTTQQADEPPTTQGRTLYSIEFKKQLNGELTTSTYYENADKQKLKDAITIDKERINKVETWRATDKKTFTQLDLGLNVMTLKNRTSNYKLNFEIPDDFSVSVDSFQLCQEYKMTKSISTGGEIIVVTLIYKSGLKDEFAFDSNDIGSGQFNLKNYVYCYTLLKDKIPSEIRNYDFFTSDKLADILLYYQKTVECEGFYYKEYTDKNPKMTSKEKRMMTGWDFIKYMGQRSNK